MSGSRPERFDQVSLAIFDDEPFDDAANPTFGVAELAEAINQKLRAGFSDGVWVRGEIDGYQVRGPHSYFSLVEDDERGRAVIGVSLFAPAKNRLTPLLKKHQLRLANGMKVRIFGHLDYYAPNGRLGLKMAGIDPRFTLGELSIARDQVVRKLVASGMYDANRRRSMPVVPLRVGVVTSVGTAAWHDFENELAVSGFGFRLSVCDTRVQGEGAAESIAAAIRSLGRRSDLDAVVVIRGGGARNELAVFDDVAIATAIATSRLPIITGLGHEIDRAIADEVAHTERKTPTAAARFLIDAVGQFSGEAEQAWNAILDRSASTLQRSLATIDGLTRSIRRATVTAVERSDDRLQGRHQRVAVASRRHLSVADKHLDTSARRLPIVADRSLDASAAALLRAERQTLAQARRNVEEMSLRLDGIAARVRLVDPADLLRRGWTITRDETGRVIRSADAVSPGAVVTTITADGVFSSRVLDHPIDREGTDYD